MQRHTNEAHLDSLLAAYLVAWATGRGIPLSALDQAPVVAARLARAAAGPAAREQAPALPGEVSLKTIEQLLEGGQTDDHRTSHGSFYTPAFVVDHLIAEAHTAAGQPAAPVVLDPCCGSGAFLLRAAAFLHQALGLPLQKVIEDHLAGVDIDPQAIENTRLMLQLLALELGETVDVSRARLVVADTVLDSPAAVLSRLGLGGGVDLLVTNPPYVKLQNLPVAYRDALRTTYGSRLQGSFSLALAYLYNAPDYLNAGGAAGFITLNNFLTSLSAEPLREWLGSDANLYRITDFGHAQVFPGVGAYTCLVFLTKRANRDVEYRRIESDLETELAGSPRHSRIPLQGLDSRKWRLAEQPHFENLKRLESRGLALGDVATIKVGFATLKDAVFLLGPSSEVPLGTLASGEAVEIEPELLKQAFRVSDLKGAGPVGSSALRWIICPYRLDGRSSVLVDEEELERRFPFLYRYLSSHRAALENRDKGRRDYPAWYAWGRTQGMSSPGPKLVTKTFDRRPQFRLDVSDALFCNGYSVAPRSVTGAPPIGLLGRYLNSRFMHYYAKLTSFQIAGDYQCYQKNFIERLAVPVTSASEALLVENLPSDQFDAWLADWYGIKLADVDAIVPRSGR